MGRRFLTIATLIGFVCSGFVAPPSLDAQAVNTGWGPWNTIASGLQVRVQSSVQNPGQQPFWQVQLQNVTHGPIWFKLRIPAWNTNNIGSTIPTTWDELGPPGSANPNLLMGVGADVPCPDGVFPVYAAVSKTRAASAQYCGFARWPARCLSRNAPVGVSGPIEY